MRRFEYPAVSEDTQTFWGGRPVNAELMFCHMPPQVTDALKGFSGALFMNGRLDPALRELAIVRVGQLCQSAYEVHHHSSFAEKLGVSADIVEQMGRLAPAGLPPMEQAVIAFVDEIVKLPRATDAALEALRGYLSDAQILELATVSGLYMMVSRMLELTGVEIDDFSIADEGIPAAFSRRD